LGLTIAQSILTLYGGSAEITVQFVGETSRRVSAVSPRNAATEFSCHAWRLSPIFFGLAD
jgi:hypothetical protein